MCVAKGTDPSDSNSANYHLLLIRKGGTVIKSPDLPSYPKGTVVTLTLTASSNELFHAWLGDIVTRDNPITLVMTNDKTVFARFTPIDFLWTNGAGGNWETASNWSPRLVPGLHDNVFINDGATVTLDTNADLIDFTLALHASTLTGSGTLTVQSNFFWSAGTLSGTGRTILETNATFDMDSQVDLLLSTRTLENGGRIFWHGGFFPFGGGAVLTNRPGGVFLANNVTASSIGGATANGQIDNAGDFRKSPGTGPLAFEAGLKLSNYGTIEVEGGTLTLNGFFSNDGAVTLAPGTTNRLAGGGRGAGTFFNAGGSFRFDNVGTFRKSVSAGTFTIGVNLTNFGTVEIQSGTLLCNGSFANNGAVNLSPGTTHRLAGGGSSVGTFEAIGSALVEWTGGPFTLNGGAALNGSGLYRISGASLNDNATLTVENLDLTVGALNSAAVLTIANQMNWTGGSMNGTGAGRTIIAPSATLNVGSPSVLGLATRTLENGAGFAAGQVGQTFALDGVNGYVQVPDSATLRPASVTIEAWVKFFATNGIRIVLVKPLGSGTFDSYGLALQDGAVIAAVADNSGFGPFLTGPANTVTGQWYHLAYTFDDSSKQQVLYVNGIPAASGTANKTMSYDEQPVLLGADVESGVLSFFHHGQIDEASLYNRALTRDEIATIYNAGAAGKRLLTTITQPLLFPPEIPGTNFKLTWTAVSNTTYRVEFNPGLSPSNWNALSGDVPGVSNTATKLDALTSSSRFYRVRVLP